MFIDDDLIARIQVKPGSDVRLKDYGTDWSLTKRLREAGKEAVKARALEVLDEGRAALSAAQERLYADDRYAVLAIFQAMDAAGKDSAIKHVMSGVNPQGCQVYSFKQPSSEELDHDFLWRCVKCLPERGRIGIFNRSYYEEVLVARVHPELLERQKLPPGKRGKSFWQERYESINAMERHLTRNGTLIVKFFLHVSKDEQRRRFLDRLEQNDKTWKFALGDVAERQHWDAYMEAYEAMLGATSTACAPWYVVPADQKWATRAIVADVLANAMQSLKLEYPEVPAAEREQLAEAHRRLKAEGNGKKGD